jgi:hypothetical protein
MLAAPLGYGQIRRPRFGGEGEAFSVPKEPLGPRTLPKGFTLAGYEPVVAILV